MTKIPLTIDKNYCADWGVWEGVRELLQNAKDADDAGAPMTVTHYPRSARLEITTARTYIDPARLLVLGTTSKTPGQARGQFGEGFVLGCLALVRKGCDVSFRNGDLSWSLAFEQPDPPHPFAGNALLTFTSRRLAHRDPDFRVTIENLPLNVWEVLKSLVLFVSPPPAASTLATPQGTLLLDPAYAGRVYARGLFVRSFPDLACGYDLPHLKLDRDRRFVDEWELHYMLSRLWQDAVAAHPEATATRIYGLVKTGAHEGRALRYHADDKLLASMRSSFTAEHGDGAVPVSTLAEAQELAALGGTPTMVNEIMRELLEKSGLSLGAARTRLETQVDARYVPDDLDDAERLAFSRLRDVVEEFHLVNFPGDQPACRLIDDAQVVGFDRRLLAAPFEASLKQLIQAEARRRGLEPFDVLLAHVARQPERAAITANRRDGLLCACNQARVPYGPPPGTHQQDGVVHGYDDCGAAPQG